MSTTPIGSWNLSFGGESLSFGAPAPVDPDLAAWQEYQRGVRNAERSGGAG